jgi:D-lactate dehydrogenase
MKIAVFNATPNDRRFLETGNVAHGYELIFFESDLTRETSELAAQFPAVCVFTSDNWDFKVLTGLAQKGIRLIMLGSDRFNDADLVASLLARL